MMLNIVKFVMPTFILGVSMAACSQSTPSEPTPKNSQIQPAENKMVVLPSNMSLGSAVIHPPRSKEGFGSTESQTLGALTGLHNLLEKQGLNLGHVMRLRTVLVAAENTTIDYDGYMAGYKKFYGTKKLPNEPLHIITEAKTLPVRGQLVLIEVDLAVPQKEENPTKNKDQGTKRPSKRIKL